MHIRIYLLCILRFHFYRKCRKSLSFQIIQLSKHCLTVPDCCVFTKQLSIFLLEHLYQFINNFQLAHFLIIWQIVNQFFVFKHPLPPKMVNPHLLFPLSKHHLPRQRSFYSIVFAVVVPGYHVLNPIIARY